MKKYFLVMIFMKASMCFGMDCQKLFENYKKGDKAVVKSTYGEDEKNSIALLFSERSYKNSKVVT